MSNARKLRVVDLATGEDMSADYTLRHRQQDESYRWKKDGKGHHFTWSNMENLHEVYEALTTAQCGYLMLLQCYVSYDDGTLVMAKDGPPMKKSDMMEVLQLDKKRRTFYDFYNACVKHGVIIEQANGTYAINDRYHFKGGFNDQFLVKSYSAKLKRVYREVKATDIGLIYRMLPFVHLKTNALCINPFERDPGKIEWFNRRELAEAIGVNADTLGRRLPQMTFDGKYVVARIKVGKEPERYTFNPSVFYRQNKKPDDTLRGMFNVRKR